ncbi:InlB B-repeat-containing protein [Candidatus Saccharibacteria bacterium]|nr:InlB B-repeat-containing protein [Candidatus Saccharibacteria bacterium]
MSDKLTASIRFRNTLLLIILPLLLTFLFTNLLTNNTYATSSLTVSSDAIINLSSLSAEGTFAKSSNIDITASTDSPSGYKLMIQANNSTSLVSGSNEITSLDPGTSISEEAFKNGNYNGKWGFKPSMFNSTANSNFLPSPSTTGDVINATACANGTGSCPNEDNYTIAIGAKVNNAQPIGAYANTFNIMLVSNGIEYSITYRNTKVSNMPEDTAGETEASTVTLASETPTRDGYNFLGWCSVQPAVDGSCSGTSYSPGQQISTSAASNLSLYARWGTTSTGNTIATATYMQDVTSCPSSLPTGTQYTLTDKRDGKTYTVSKLADNKCWMTQNLDLDIGGEGTAMLTSENTNLTTSGSGAYVVGYKTNNGTVLWIPLDKAMPSGRPISGTTVTGWEDKYNFPVAAEGGDVYAYTSGSDSDDTVYESLSACTSASHSATDCKHYHIGNYYNWNAAVASNNTTSLATQYTTAENDICPKGWRLPIGASSATASAETREFGQLFLSSGVTGTIDATAYADGGFNKVRANPLFFVRGGGVFGSSLSSSGNNGYYWSSSVGSTYSAYYVNFSSSYVYSAYNGYRRPGQSLRCMVR